MKFSGEDINSLNVLLDIFMNRGGFETPVVDIGYNNDKIKTEFTYHSNEYDVELFSFMTNTVKEALRLTEAIVNTRTAREPS